MKTIRKCKQPEELNNRNTFFFFSFHLGTYADLLGNLS